MSLVIQVKDELNKDRPVSYLIKFNVILTSHHYVQEVCRQHI